MTHFKREICWDTETTGLSPERDRVIEIACVELIDLIPTGKHYTVLIDPERDIPAEVTKIHGYTREMLRGKPKFADIIDDFLEFIGDSPMIAHNAKFDIGMINGELARLKRSPLSNESIDTLVSARKKFPGARVTLDDLCRRFKIDLSLRTKHSALIDTQLLAKVYLELMGGRHHNLDFSSKTQLQIGNRISVERPHRISREIGLPSQSEISIHDEFLKKLKNPLWNMISQESPNRDMKAN